MKFRTKRSVRYEWPAIARALLLDLDGTLVDSREAVEASWRLAARELGVPFAVLAPFIHGIPAEAALAAALPGLPISQRTHVAHQVLQRQASPASPAKLVPGARNLLSSLPERWAIVTSGDLTLARSSITNADIPEPPVLITAESVKLGKPSPEPYLAAAAALNVSPDDCLVMEDSPAGITSGLRAGMRVLAVRTTHGSPELVEADAQIDSLENVTLAVTGDAFVLHRSR